MDRATVERIEVAALAELEREIGTLVRRQQAMAARLETLIRQLDPNAAAPGLGRSPRRGARAHPGLALVHAPSGRLREDAATVSPSS